MQEHAAAPHHAGETICAAHHDHPGHGARRASACGPHGPRHTEVPVHGSQCGAERTPPDAVDVNKKNSENSALLLR
jgi:hypothetical protein